MIAALLSLALALGPGEAGSAMSDAALEQSPVCETGPITRRYGDSDWQVFGCDDGKSVVVVSTPGSPAHSFYFILTPIGDEVRLYGEGTGGSDATRAAFKELDQLSVADVAALAAAARAAAQGRDASRDESAQRR